MKRFDGKTAWWLYLLLVLYNLTPIAILLFDKSFEWTASTIICFVLSYLFNVVWLPIMIIDWVDVYDDYFVFHYGFSKFVVKIEDVVEIKKSHNPVSATANSFDRVYVKTTKKSFYLSLYKNDEFVELITSKMNIQTND